MLPETYILFLVLLPNYVVFGEMTQNHEWAVTCPELPPPGQNLLARLAVGRGDNLVAGLVTYCQ